MRRNTTVLDRLAAARPDAARRAAETLDAGEREHLLREVLANQGPRAPRRHVPLAAAVATAAAAALSVAVVRTPEPASPPAAGETSGAATRAPEVDRVALVTSRARAALAASEGDPVHARLRMTSRNGSVVTTEVWSANGGRDDRFTSAVDGAPAYDIASSVGTDGVVNVTVVDHGRRAWWTYTRDAGPEHVPAGRETVTPVGMSSEEIRMLLDKGALRLVGEETLDGRETLRLAGQPKNAVDASGNVVSSGGTLDLWIDADSYLPVRAVTVLPGGTRLEQDIEFVPADEFDPARLRVVPPDGYVRLPRPPVS